MEDARLEWIRDRVYHGLNISDPNIFEIFLEDDKYDDIMRKESVAQKFQAFLIENFRRHIQTCYSGVTL